MQSTRYRVQIPSIKTWRERAAAFQYVPRLLIVTWRTQPALAVAAVTLRLARSVIPVSSLWIAKLIIDGVIAARSNGPNWHHLWVLLGLDLGLAVVADTLSRLSQLSESLLSSLLVNRLNAKIIEHAAALDLAQFEDPEVSDHIARARKSVATRMALLSQLLTFAQSGVTLFTLSAALLLFSPWLCLLLIISTVPILWVEGHFARKQYAVLFYRAARLRELEYVSDIGTTQEVAKEVKIFGLASWLIDRYRRLAETFYHEDKALSLGRATAGGALNFVATGIYYGAYVLMIARAVAGVISIGTLTLLSGSFIRARDLLQGMLLGVASVAEQAFYLRDLFTFFELVPTMENRPRAVLVPRKLIRGFQFEEVGFRYPGSDRWALRNVTFHLDPGERLALVGVNGAGKTTLVKLLSRLYDPSVGRILLDGVDLREYDVPSLRRAVGVIFQDFVRYDMQLDENILVGRIDEAREYLARQSALGEVQCEPPEFLNRAAESSFAVDLVRRFPLGYRQLLGRRFESGMNLSGGEWQKIALARAHVRDAQLVILDEPTAALDARAEHEIFQRFANVIGDRMAVVISHRFSTVRMADRILVMNSDGIVEQGSHDQLMERGGVYAELFELQAAGYR